MGTICILHIRFLYLCVSAYVYIPIPLLFAFSSPHITNAVHSCQSAVSYFKSSLIHTSHSRNQIFTKILSLFITVLKGVCSYYPILPYISILPPLLDLAVPWRESTFHVKLLSGLSRRPLIIWGGLRQKLQEKRYCNWLPTNSEPIEGFASLKQTKKKNLKWNQYSIPQFSLTCKTHYTSYIIHIIIYTLYIQHYIVSVIFFSY